MTVSICLLRTCILYDKTVVIITYAVVLTVDLSCIVSEI